MTQNNESSNFLHFFRLSILENYFLWNHLRSLLCFLFLDFIWPFIFLRITMMNVFTQGEGLRRGCILPTNIWNESCKDFFINANIRAVGLVIRQQEKINGGHTLARVEVIACVCGNNKVIISELIAFLSANCKFELDQTAKWWSLSTSTSGLETVRSLYFTKITKHEYWHLLAACFPKH